jgi:hypothetical protein
VIWGIVSGDYFYYSENPGVMGGIISEEMVYRLRYLGDGKYIGPVSAAISRTSFRLYARIFSVCAGCRCHQMQPPLPANGGLRSIVS